MGADSFKTFACGKDADAAFGCAVEAASYEHGHGGYTGTIAEKRDFFSFGKVASVEEAKQKMAAVRDQVDDKWGPAGCIEVEDPVGARTPKPGEKLFLFFGWASSRPWPPTAAASTRPG